MSSPLAFLFEQSFDVPHFWDHPAGSYEQNLVLNHFNHPIDYNNTQWTNKTRSGKELHTTIYSDFLPGTCFGSTVSKASSGLPMTPRHQFCCSPFHQEASPHRCSMGALPRPLMCISSWEEADKLTAYLDRRFAFNTLQRFIHLQRKGQRIRIRWMCFQGRRLVDV